MKENVRIIKNGAALSWTVIVLSTSLLSGCWSSGEQEDDPLFEKLSSSRTGVTFSNEVTYDPSFNLIDFSYLYNGGGIAIGDINNDGLPDIYLTGNMVSSRLYLNKGNFEFEDIMESAGTGTTGWAGGVSMVDINHDGYLDIYVSVTGPEDTEPSDRKNLLFINNRDETFTEKAEEYGLADTGFTTHAVFFDYDLDGDLDAFLINNFAGTFSRDNSSGLRPEINDGTSKSTDALYRNNGNDTFTEVSQQAGILNEGYSLGVAVSDINRDGYPDIYISNDVQPDDLLYINNGDGTFTDRSADYFKHTSYAGMGADIADFNNDGWPDILQVDMLPPLLKDQKRVTGSVSHEYHLKQEQMGYQRQYTANTLQLSNGLDQEGNVLFSEIGRLAGITATDWSWTGLFGDYDNDGWKDIMITNGYPKAANDYDYLVSLSQSTMFGSDSSRKQKIYEMMDELEGYKPSNYFYKNNGDLTFSEVSDRWGFTIPSFSYGAAHADMDNDGDLDIIVNNLNGEAGVYNNRADTLLKTHYLSIKLQGDSLNTFGIGTRVKVTAAGETQVATFWPYRGYQSSVDASRLYFGLGEASSVDSLEVRWPDGSNRLFTDLEADQEITIEYNQKHSRETPAADSMSTDPHIVKETDNMGIDYRHKENYHVDFNNEPLLPRMLSRLGPAAAAADISNDGRQDLFLGGAAGEVGQLYIQQSDGTFSVSDYSQPWEGDASMEDTGALFFDANNDGAMDLYVVSGGNSYSPASAQLQDRLYLNNGDGKFIKTNDMLPNMYTSGSTVKAADYDDDGDLDLFIAGRHVPGRYPAPARSYILRNDASRFTDVTSEIAPQLVEPGLVTDAEWVDFNGDGSLDLVLAGIWMPVRFYQNDGDGRFQDVTAELGVEQHVGWWQSIQKGDIDGDGNMDIVAGNIGLNCVDGKSSMHLLVNDFDGNQRHEAISAVLKDGKYYPVHGMRNMTRQFPGLSRRIPSFEAYSEASLSDIFGGQKIEEAQKMTADNLSTSVFLNQDGTHFTVKPLPHEVQLSPANDMLLFDINGDAILDIVTAGNIYNTNPEMTRCDAGNGLILLGSGDGHFNPLSPLESGFAAPRNARKLELIHTSNGAFILVINNDEALQVFKVNTLKK